MRKIKKSNWKNIDLFTPFMILLWMGLVVSSLFLSYYYVGEIKDAQEKTKLLANFFMMLATFSGAFFLFYITEHSKKKSER